MAAFLLLTFGLFAANTARAKEIAFTCPEKPESPIFKSLELAYAYFFKMHGYTFSMQTTSEQRMILEITNGRFDGTCGQNSTSFEHLNSSQLIHGNAPIARLFIKSLSRKKHRGLDSLDQLQNSPFRVGIIAGTAAAILANQLAIPFYNIVDIDRGVKMLAGGRLDYVISNDVQLNRALQELRPTTPLQLSNTLMSLNIYPTLNQRHRHLLPTLDQYLFQLNHCLGGPLSQITLGAWLSISSETIERCLTPPLEPQS